MRTEQIKYPLSFVSSLLLTLFALSIVWCGDFDCLAGGTNEDCSALICTLLDKHSTENENPMESSNKDCSCVCHMSALVSKSLGVKCFHGFQLTTLTLTLVPPSAPAKRIYHPPLVG